MSTLTRPKGSPLAFQYIHKINIHKTVCAVDHDAASSSQDPATSQGPAEAPPSGESRGGAPTIAVEAKVSALIMRAKDSLILPTWTRSTIILITPTFAHMWMMCHGIVSRSSHVRPRPPRAPQESSASHLSIGKHIRTKLCNFND